MDDKTVTRAEFIQKKAELLEPHIPLSSLSLYHDGTDHPFARSVTHEDFPEKHAEYQAPIRHDGSSFTLANNGTEIFGRSITQDEFTGIMGERPKPVVHTSSLRLADPGGNKSGKILMATSKLI